MRASCTHRIASKRGSVHHSQRCNRRLARTHKRGWRVERFTVGLHDTRRRFLGVGGEHRRATSVRISWRLGRRDPGKHRRLSNNPAGSRPRRRFAGSGAGSHRTIGEHRRRTREDAPVRSAVQPPSEYVGAGLLGGQQSDFSQVRSSLSRVVGCWHNRR